MFRCRIAVALVFACGACALILPAQAAAERPPSDPIDRPADVAARLAQAERRIAQLERQTAQLRAQVDAMKLPLATAPRSALERAQDAVQIQSGCPEGSVCVAVRCDAPARR